MKPSVRPRLLEAAIVLFAEHGYSGVNVQDILLKAATNLNSFRTYFTDKKGAFAAVLEEELERAPAASEMAMMLVQNRKKQDMRSLVRHMVQSWYESLSLQTARLLTYTFLSGHEEWRKKANKYLSQVTEVIASSIGEIETASTAKYKLNPEAAAKLLVLALLGLKVIESAPRPAKARSAEADLIIDQCLYPLFASAPKEK